MKGITCCSYLLLAVVIATTYVIVEEVKEIRKSFEVSITASSLIKRSIYKMGPGHSYQMVGDKLYVWQDNEWLRLRKGK